MVLSSGGIPDVATKYLFYKKKDFKNNYRLGNQDSCYEVFKDLNIITLTPKYVYSVLCITSNRDEFALVAEMK